MVMGAVGVGAFFGGLADRMRDNREYTKSKTDEMQTFLLQTGLKRQNEVATARQKLTEATDFLSSKGLDESNVLALLDTNPREMIRLYGAALKAEARGDLNATLLNQSVITSAGYTTPDMSPSELIKAATPDFVQGSELERPAEREGGVLQKMFRTPGIQEIMYDAYSSDVLGLGAKGKDIQASATADLFQKDTTGSSGSVETDLGVFAEQDDFTPAQFEAVKKQVIGLYNQRYDNMTDTAIALLKDVTEDTPDTEVLTVGGEEFTVGELREIKNAKLKIDMLKDQSKDFEAYQEIMKLDPSIAQRYIAQGGVTAQVFTSPYGFGYNQTYMEDLLGGD